MSERVRVLVVEDERTSALLVQRDLRKLGYGIAAIAMTGEEAIRLAREKRPDLVLMDIGLEGELDGIDAAIRICAERTVPIVFITAAGDPETIERAKGQGAFGYLVKPFSLYGLHSAMELALHRRKLEQELADREELLAAILASVQEGIFALDGEGRIAFLNRTAERMTGRSDREAVGRRLGEIAYLEPLSPPHEGLFRLFPLGGDPPPPGERAPVPVPVERRETALSGQAAKRFGSIVVLRDVSAQLKAEEAIRHQATHDALTGLPNRVLFMDRLHQALALARRERSRLALLFMDLDNFKGINDTLGHDAGDTLLIEAAERLATLIRESDTAARMGGDEFTFILQRIADASSAALTAERLLRTLRAPFLLRGKSRTVSGSVGIALFPDHGEDPVTLMRRADLAMYRAKTAGRNRVHLYNSREGEEEVEEAGDR